MDHQADCARLLVAWGYRVGGGLLAVVMIAMCQPPNPLAGFLGFVAYAPMFVVLRRERNRFAFPLMLGFAIGAVQALILGRWSVQGILHPVLALSGLAVFQGLLWAVAALVIRALLTSWAAISWWAILVIPAMDWARARNPFLPIGYCRTECMTAENLWFSQWVEPLGEVGMAILLAGSSWFVSVIWEAQGRSRLRRIVCWIAFLATMHVVGYFRMAAWDRDGQQTVKVTFIQQYAPRSPGGGLRKQKSELLDRLHMWIGGDTHDLLILPETSLYVPPPPQDETVQVEYSRLTPAELADLLAKRNGPPTVAGVIIDVPEQPGAHRNAVGLVVPVSGMVEARDKLIAAPIGETVPFSGVPLLGRLGQLASETEGRLITHDARAVLPVPGGPRLAVAVCHEHTFPAIWSRRGLDSLENIDFQVIVADMGWFGYDEQERGQSRAARRLLAIRHRRSLLYVANGGSEWINPAGKLQMHADARDKGGTWNVPLPKGEDPARVPEFVPTIVLAIAAMAGVLGTCFSLRK